MGFFIQDIVRGVEGVAFAVAVNRACDVPNAGLLKNGIQVAFADAKAT